MIGTEKIPYDELDPNIVNLCTSVNAFDGLETIGSCGAIRILSRTKNQKVVGG